MQERGNEEMSRGHSGDEAVDAKCVDEIDLQAHEIDGETHANRGVGNCGKTQCV
jgi:hypothetical protein